MVVPFYPFAYLHKKMTCRNQKDFYMGIPFRPLGIVTDIVERMGLGVTYSYDDLVFISHNAFMLRFGEQGELLDVFFNKDCPDSESESIEKQLLTYCEEYGLILSRKGTYELSENPNQTLSIQFFEDSDGATLAQ